MRSRFGKDVRPWAVLAAAGLLCLAPPLRAQGTGRPTVSDSRDGYIDSAIPGNEFRLRYDTSYDNTRPTRAEFIYPKGGPNGRGLPIPERRVDFQDVSGYLEAAATDRLSGFVELP